MRRNSSDAGNGELMRRFKVEYVNLPDSEPLWFDTRDEVDSLVRFTKSCPVDDGPVKLRITEFAQVKVEIV